MSIETTNIYLMQDERSGLYKIGRSQNPMNRERTLLSQSPSVVLRCYWKDKYVFIESNLHQRFADKRQRGEWFKLADEDILTLCDDLPILWRGRKDVCWSESMQKALTDIDARTERWRGEWRCNEARHSIQRLQPQELEQFKAWFLDYCKK